MNITSLPPNPNRSVTAELEVGSGVTPDADVVVLLLGLFKLSKSNSVSRDNFVVLFSKIFGFVLDSDFLATSFGLCLSLKKEISVSM